MPQPESESVLREMAARADVIFVGTVTAVHKGTDEDLRSNAASLIVEVDFAVEHFVKGTSQGSVYAMREWAGLWRDSPRFTVGQRLLMLLHAAGPGGLSSPVDGLDGAIPIRIAVVSPILAGRPTALATQAVTDGPQDDAVDMRWLQARTLRVQTFQDEPTASPGEGSPDEIPLNAPLARAAKTSEAATTELATGTGLMHVLSLLKSWQGNGNVSR